VCEVFPYAEVIEDIRELLYHGVFADGQGFIKTERNFNRGAGERGSGGRGGMNYSGESGMRGYLNRKMWDLDSKNAETVDNMTQDQIAERIKALAAKLEPDELREVTTDLAGTMDEANQSKMIGQLLGGMESKTKTVGEGTRVSGQLKCDALLAGLATLEYSEMALLQRSMPLSVEFITGLSEQYMLQDLGSVVKALKNLPLDIQQEVMHALMNTDDLKAREVMLSTCIKRMASTGKDHQYQRHEHQYHEHDGGGDGALVHSLASSSAGGRSADGKAENDDVDAALRTTVMELFRGLTTESKIASLPSLAKTLAAEERAESMALMLGTIEPVGQACELLGSALGRLDDLYSAHSSAPENNDEAGGGGYDSAVILIHSAFEELPPEQQQQLLEDLLSTISMGLLASLMESVVMTSLLPKQRATLMTSLIPRLSERESLALVAGLTSAGNQEDTERNEAEAMAHARRGSTGGSTGGEGADVGRGRYLELVAPDQRALLMKSLMPSELSLQELRVLANNIAGCGGDGLAGFMRMLCMELGQDQQELLLSAALGELKSRPQARKLAEALEGCGVNARQLLSLPSVVGTLEDHVHVANALAAVDGHGGGDEDGKKKKRKKRKNAPPLIKVEDEEKDAEHRAHAARNGFEVALVILDGSNHLVAADAESEWMGAKAAGHRPQKLTMPLTAEDLGLCLYELMQTNGGKAGTPIAEAMGSLYSRMSRQQRVQARWWFCADDAEGAKGALGAANDLNDTLDNMEGKLRTIEEQGMQEFQLLGLDDEEEIAGGKGKRGGGSSSGSISSDPVAHALYIVHAWVEHHKKNACGDTGDRGAHLSDKEVMSVLRELHELKGAYEVIKEPEAAHMAEVEAAMRYDEEQAKSKGDSVGAVISAGRRVSMREGKGKASAGTSTNKLEKIRMAEQQRRSALLCHGLAFWTGTPMQALDWSKVEGSESVQAFLFLMFAEFPLMCPLRTTLLPLWRELRDLRKLVKKRQQGLQLQKKKADKSVLSTWQRAAKAIDVINLATAAQREKTHVLSPAKGGIGAAAREALASGSVNSMKDALHKPAGIESEAASPAKRRGEAGGAEGGEATVKVDQSSEDFTRAMIVRVGELREQIHALHERVYKGNLMWQRAQRVVLQALVHVTGGPMKQLMCEERDEDEATVFEEAFHHLKPGSIDDMLKGYSDEEVAEQYDLIGELFGGVEHRSTMRAVFKAYACMGCLPSSIARETFKHFTTDCQIVANRAPPEKKMGGRNTLDVAENQVTEAQADIIFVRAMRRDGAARAGGAGGSSDLGLGPADFMQAIIRLANAKLVESHTTAGADAGKSEAASDAGKKPKKAPKKGKKRRGITLANAVQQILEENVLPNATRSDVEAFRLLVQKDHVQEMFAKYREPLYRLFNTYAADDKKDEVKEAQNLKEFTKLLQDKGVINNSFSRQTVQCVFNNAQMTRYGSQGEEETQMDHEEFLEAVSAVAMCTFPNPYVAFEKRLEWTVQQLLREKPKKGKKGKSFAAATFMLQSASSRAVEDDAPVE
jgi:hypothetical protein